MWTESHTCENSESYSLDRCIGSNLFVWFLRGSMMMKKIYLSRYSESRQRVFMVVNEHCVEKVTPISTMQKMRVIGLNDDDDS